MTLSGLTWSDLVEANRPFEKRERERERREPELHGRTASQHLAKKQAQGVTNQKIKIAEGEEEEEEEKSNMWNTSWRGRGHKREHKHPELSCSWRAGAEDLELELGFSLANRAPRGDWGRGYGKAGVDSVGGWVKRGGRIGV